MRTSKKRTENPAVRRAIQIAGSQKALADALDCPQSAISKRLLGSVPITGEWAVEVERILKGAITREEIRPDLFRRPAA
jgi:DNA-binding transcriptional regulator YdaS (Cro superfamily)